MVQSLDLAVYCVCELHLLLPENNLLFKAFEVEKKNYPQTDFINSGKRKLIPHDTTDLFVGVLNASFP